MTLGETLPATTRTANLAGIMFVPLLAPVRASLAVVAGVLAIGAVA